MRLRYVDNPAEYTHYITSFNALVNTMRKTAWDNRPDMLDIIDSLLDKVNERFPLPDGEIDG